MKMQRFKKYIISSLKIVEKLFFQRSNFWHDNYLKAMDQRDHLTKFL